MSFVAAISSSPNYTNCSSSSAVEASGSYIGVEQEGGASCSSFPSSFHDNAQTIQQVFSQSVGLPPIASERQMPQFMNVSPSIALYPSLHASAVPETEVQKGLDQVEIARRARSRELLMFLQTERPHNLTVFFEFPQIAYMNMMSLKNMLAEDRPLQNSIVHPVTLERSQTEIASERRGSLGREARNTQRHASTSSLMSTHSQEKQAAHIPSYFHSYFQSLESYKSHKWNWQEVEVLLDLNSRKMTHRDIAVHLQKQFPFSSFTESSVGQKLRRLQSKAQEVATDVLQ